MINFKNSSNLCCNYMNQAVQDFWTAFLLNSSRTLIVLGELITLVKLCEMFAKISESLLKNHQPCVIIHNALLYYLEEAMAVSYSKLWKVLVDKEMSKADLRKKADISLNTMTRMRKNEPVTLVLLSRICKELNVDFGDIVSYVPDEESKT